MMAEPNASDSETNTVTGWIRIRVQICVQICETVPRELSSEIATAGAGARRLEPGSGYSSSRRIRPATAISSQHRNEEVGKSFQTNCGRGWDEFGRPRSNRRF